MNWRERFGGALLASCLLLAGTAAEAGIYSNMYVFGDSLSDVGNDLIVTGGAVPSPAYYTDGSTTGRFTNGLNYVDYLAGSLGLGIAPSRLGGTDYAYGGARTNSVAAGLPPTALNFNQQIGSYLGGGTADPNALYVLWIGANDMSDTILAAAAAAKLGTSASDIQTTIIGPSITSVMGSIATAIGGLAGLGAQHFLVPNLPNLALIPEVNGVGSPQLSALAGGISVGFNQALASTLSLKMFSVLDINTLDVFGAQTQMTLDPAAYGLSNVTSACYDGQVDGSGPPTPTVCANPDQYLYWDFEHPTTVLHAELGRLALAAVVPEPASLSMIFAGLGLLGVMRRRQLRG